MKNSTLAPWQFVSRQLTSWLLEHIDYKLEKQTEKCDCCGATPEQWPTPGEAVSYVDSYKRDLIVCEDCITLYLSNLEVMGTEAIRKGGNAVPNKFGMLSSVRVVADQNGVTMLAPKKIADKLPDSFPVNLYVYDSLADADIFLMTTEWEYPAVFIADLGKKKGEMVENLTYSYSPRRVRFCTAEKVEERNLDAIKACIEKAKTMEKKELSQALKLLAGTGGGKLSPAELFAEVKALPDTQELLKLATPDPVARMIIAKVLKNV